MCVYVCASERDKITCTQRVAPSGWRQERVKVTGTGWRKQEEPKSEGIIRDESGEKKNYLQTSHSSLLFLFFVLIAFRPHLI